MVGELSRLGSNHTTSLSLNAELNADRLASRNTLLAGLDKIRREVDATGMMDAMDRFSQQATGILLSGKFADALIYRKKIRRLLSSISQNGALPVNDSQQQMSRRQR